jgi:hypothetical protein
MYSPTRSQLPPKSFICVGAEDDTSVATAEAAVKENVAPVIEPASPRRRIGFLGALLSALAGLFQFTAQLSLDIGQSRPGDGVKWWR